jgi:hypothetical protein
MQSGSGMGFTQQKNATIGWPAWALSVLLALASGTGIAEEESVQLKKPEGWVERAVFTTAVESREPVDQVAILPDTERQVFFFTDLRELQGRTITHRWEYQGQVMAEVPFEVKGPRWRVFSRKSLDPSQLGKWTVIIVDESGWPLRAAIFEYRASAGNDASGAISVRLPVVEQAEH